MEKYDVSSPEGREEVYEKFLISISTDATNATVKQKNEELSHLFAEAQYNMLDINIEQLRISAIMETHKRSRKTKIKETASEWSLSADKQKSLVETCIPEEIWTEYYEITRDMLFWTEIISHLDRVSKRVDSIGKSIGLEAKIR